MSALPRPSPLRHHLQAQHGLVRDDGHLQAVEPSHLRPTTVRIAGGPDAHGLREGGGDAVGGPQPHRPRRGGGEEVLGRCLAGSPGRYVSGLRAGLPASSRGPKQIRACDNKVN